MSFFRWGPKPSVAQQRAKAEKLLARMGKARALSPVVIEGNKIASSFWGKAWCDNLERYSDYANRLPRGRSYVRNRCVVDLQIASGEVTAEVSGSFKTLCSLMEAIPKGNRLVLTYVPGTGTTVEVNGKMKGTLPGKATADAILSTWLGGGTLVLVAEETRRDPEALLGVLEQERIERLYLPFVALRHLASLVALGTDGPLFFRINIVDLRMDRH